MPPLDDSGLSPVSADAPTGENLELDPEFGALERAIQGKPETQYGSTIEPAVPPDWKEAAAIAESLLGRTHDLRILTYLATARLNLKGIPEYAAVVRQIRYALEQYWLEVHPQLDPEDDNDPMLRSNAVLMLQDSGRVLRPLRDATLANSPRTGPVTWRDLAVMAATMEADADKEPMTEAFVIGAFEGTNPERLTATREALDNLLEDLPAISAVFDTNSGPATGPNYDNIIKLLRDIKRDVNKYAKAPAAPSPEMDAEEKVAADGAETAPSAAGAPARGGGFASIQAITSLTRRDDAVHALLLASSYFRMYEPSSPLPMLIDRARRVAAMDFLDILRELAPDGVSQAEFLAGSNAAG